MSKGFDMKCHRNVARKMSMRTLLAVSTLPLVLLCSCKGLGFRERPNSASNLPSPNASIRAGERGAGVSPAGEHAAVSPMGSLTSEGAAQASYLGQAGRLPHGGHQHQAGYCPHCGPGTLPVFAFTEMYSEESGLPWKPPGIKCPWPPDEYICDGGDLNNDVRVKQDWTVVGLDQEDTIAHYDTLDGHTEVTPSNCVCIYAPRFAAVRQVTTPILQEAHERMADVVLPTKVNIHEETRIPKTANQPEQPIAQVGLDQAQAFRERTKGLLVDVPVRLVLAAEAFLPREELLFLQRGEFDASEKARLAQRVAAAIVWTDNQAVQILIDGKPAVEARGLAKPEVTYTYELEGKPRLKLCKIADKSEAQPGEIVTFTLRFDNVGEQKIGNVTIIDHLMPRLEYVAESAQSTLEATFNAQEQIPGESLVLRWEIKDPLEVNQGGMIRFQARVR